MFTSAAEFIQPIAHSVSILHVLDYAATRFSLRPRKSLRSLEVLDNVAIMRNLAVGTIQLRRLRR